MDETIQGQSQVQEAQPAGAMPTPEKTADEEVAQTAQMSERTREQFEKLKKHNEELASKLAQLEQAQQQQPQRSVLDELYPTQVESQSSSQEVSDYQISEDGSVDVEQLNKALKEARELAQKARDEALLARKQVEEQQRRREEARVHEKYPQLVPGSKSFDPDFYKRVKNELVGQMMEGKTDYMNAAETVAKLFQVAPSVTKQVEDKVEEFKKTTENLQHINAGTSSATNRTFTDEQELVRRTRQGDLSAFAERLKRAGL